MPKMTSARRYSGVAALILMVLGLIIAFGSGVSAGPDRKDGNQGLQFERLGFDTVNRSAGTRYSTAKYCI
jgi:hypothetical protein